MSFNSLILKRLITIQYYHYFLSLIQFALPLFLSLNFFPSLITGTVLVTIC
jgi:hypothetical protein